MLKRLFALATVSALALVVVSTAGAGCSSTSDPATPTEAGPDARPHPDTGAEDAEGPKCPSTAPITPADPRLAYKDPNAAKTDCSVADHEALVDYFAAADAKGQTVTLSQVDTFLKGRGQECHDCVFTDAKAATWGPLPVADGQLVTINWGMCYALLSGRNEVGKAVQQWSDCLDLACVDCVDDRSTLQACYKKAANGACKDVGAQGQTVTASVDIDALDDACTKFTDLVRVACVGALPDGGGDSGDASEGGDGGDD